MWPGSSAATWACQPLTSQRYRGAEPGPVLPAPPVTTASASSRFCNLGSASEISLTAVFGRMRLERAQLSRSGPLMARPSTLGLARPAHRQRKLHQSLRRWRSPPPPHPGPSPSPPDTAGVAHWQIEIPRDGSADATLREQLRRSGLIGLGTTRTSDQGGTSTLLRSGARWGAPRDRRAVGRHVAALEAVRAAIGAPRVVLIGRPWGTTLAAAHMACHTGRVARAAMTGPDPIWQGKNGLDREVRVLPDLITRPRL